MTAIKGATLNAAVVARLTTRRFLAPGRCVWVVYAKTGHSVKICTTVIYVLVCGEDARVSEDNTFSVLKKEVFLCAVPGRFLISLGRGVVMRLRGTWKISW